ncbi:MAG: HAMP domain-containing histidine kinase [Anaerolineales bacterium]|nr:MAG: HAMP domain-containing histidine kinase [Anaerolineales bacterium]
MNSPQKPEPTTDKIRRFEPFQIYTACVSGLGVALLVWSLGHLEPSHAGVLLFIGLVIVAELTTSENLSPNLLFSMSAAVTFAGILVFGPLPGGLVAMVGGVVSTLVMERRQGGRRRAPLLQRALFNMAGFGLPAPVAGWIYILAGGIVGEVALVSNLLPMVLAAVSFEAVNAGLVVGVVSLQTSQPAVQIWRQNMSWITPMNILSMVVGGGGLAVGYQIAGILGLSVFFLPLVLTIYATRLYVAQTKAQMDRLEEIIAERTEDLQKANVELRRLDRVKTNFFSVINHEMRTPLTAIAGYTELLLERTKLSPDQGKMLQTIKSNSHRLLDLVNNILDVARLEEGKLTVVPAVMGMLPAVKQALAVIHPLAQVKHISINVDVSPETAYVWGDPQRVSQILVNLLSNAVKFTPDTGTITISARRSETADEAVIAVTDTGVGIPAERLPQVFERFGRLERAEIQHTIGTGLGLSIVRGLVEAHGGRIWVESEEGRGTCFAFTLPLAAQHTSESIPEEQLTLEGIGLTRS